MSEHQYYEFLALDQSLSAEDLAYVRTLSRRVQPTPTQALFTYSGGDFPGEPLDLLAQHYDAMLYLANWGSKQLALRFPKTAIDQQKFQPYAYGVEEIELTTVGQYAILNIAFHEGDPLGWLVGAGILAGLAPLRDDILRGDLRVLYLAWLASVTRGGGLASDDEGAWEAAEERELANGDDLIEPPVPPGLGQLTAPLLAFMRFFDIDQDIVGAAAVASPPLHATEEPIERWVALLPEAERNAFLARVARGEPIGSELLLRLHEVGGGAGQVATTTPRRTFAALVTAAEEVRHQRQERERQAAEQARLAKLDALARREEQVWAQLPGLLARRTASGYDEAVTHLADLRELAAQRGQRAAFDARLRDVLTPYATSGALRKRLRERRLVG